MLWDEDRAGDGVCGLYMTYPREDSSEERVLWGSDRFAMHVEVADDRLRVVGGLVGSVVPEHVWRVNKLGGAPHL